MRVSQNGIAAQTASAEIILLIIASGFIESVLVVQIVRAIDPVKQVYVDGITVEERIGPGREGEAEDRDKDAPPFL